MSHHYGGFRHSLGDTLGQVVASLRAIGAEHVPKIQADVVENNLPVETERVSDRTEAEILGRIETEVDKLDNRTAAVLRLRFGLAELPSMTLEEVGECFGITRERVRQIEEGALSQISETLGISGEQIEQIKDVANAERTLKARVRRVRKPDRPVRRYEFIDNQRMADTDWIFAILCEHIILAGANGARIVKNPVTILEVRESFLFHEAAGALENLVSKELIEGSPPWQIIRIIPEVPLPEYGRYRDGIPRGPKRKMENGEAGLISPARQGLSGLLRADFISRRRPRNAGFGGRFFPRRGSGRPPRYRNVCNRRLHQITCCEAYNLLRGCASAISGESVVHGAVLILEQHLHIYKPMAVHILECLGEKGYLESYDDWRSVALRAGALDDNSLIF